MERKKTKNKVQARTLITGEEMYTHSMSVTTQKMFLAVIICPTSASSKIVISDKTVNSHFVFVQSLI